MSITLTQPPAIKIDKPLCLTASDSTTSPVQRTPSKPRVIMTQRPRRNFNPKRTARYGRPAFNPDVLVKYSPKWSYHRLFNFPFRGSHFRPRMHTLVLSIDGGCRVNDCSKYNSHAACAVYFGPNHAYNYVGLLTHHEPHTSNRAELQAAIVALQRVQQWLPSGGLELVRELVVMTDSTYVARSLGEWVWGWERNGWTKRRGGVVENVDQIRALHETIQMFEQDLGIAVRFWRVGREWNEEADRMVNERLDGEVVRS